MSGSRVGGSHVGIVGGGVLGLTLALRLRQRGHEVTVFESSATSSGLAAATTIGEYTWDRFSHVMLPSDAHLLGLLDELGLDEDVRWRVARTGFHIGGKLHALSSLGELLFFPALGLVEKGRLALTILRATRARDLQSLEKLGAAEWLQSWSGKRTYERIWLPLLKAQLGENYDKANAAFICAMLARAYAAHRVSSRRGVFGYVAGGHSVILEALSARLAQVGVRFEAGVQAARVIDSMDAATILLRDGRVSACDHAIVTTPPPITARLCPQLTDTERTRLEGVAYQGLLCMAVLLRRPLGGFYLTNIATPGMPFTSVIDITALVPPAMFGGHSLVYLPRYAAQDDSYWSLSDTTIRNRFLSALGAMYPRLATSDVVACEISRIRHALTIPTQDYSRDVRPSLETSRPRIHLVNAAQIAHGALSIDDAVALADAQAALLDARIAPREVRIHTPWPGIAASGAGRAR